MKTRIITVKPVHPDLEALGEAARALREGGTVAFPTETVYGLGANAFDPDAVARIFEAKGRPSDNPLIVHIAEREALDDLVAEVPANAHKLIKRFWPGPLTVVLPKRDHVPDAVTAGLSTVAIRMPDHDVALALISLAGVPVAAPSANRSGRPSPTTAAHVREDMDGHIAVIVDGGPSGIGVESTVVDATTNPVTLLRPGGVTREDLVAVLGALNVDPALHAGAHEKVVPRSPGLKYTHYAPKAPLTLVIPGPEGETGLVPNVWSLAEGELHAGRATGLLLLDEDVKELVAEAKRAGWAARVFEAASDASEALETQEAEAMDDLGIGHREQLLIVKAGSRTRPAEVATRLFAALRRFDELGVEAIIAEGLSEDGLGFAVMNRLRKAAGGRIIQL